jgi:hypothetical protein
VSVTPPPGGGFLGMAADAEGTYHVYVHDHGSDPVMLSSDEARDMAAAFEHHGRWEDRDRVMLWAARVDQWNRSPAATLH